MHFDKEISNTLPYHVPSGCPPTLTYMPPWLRSKLIAWAHASPASGHPGTRRTLELIKGKYWWPTSSQDVNRQFASCSTSAQAEVLHLFPTGKLMPLVNLQHPWSHVAVDYITDLPESDGKTVVLVVVDCWFPASVECHVDSCACC